jgi:hypothetical protein
MGAVWEQHAAPPKACPPKNRRKRQPKLQYSVAGPLYFLHCVNVAHRLQALTLTFKCGASHCDAFASPDRNSNERKRSCSFLGGPPRKQCESTAICPLHLSSRLGERTGAFAFACKESPTPRAEIKSPEISSLGETAVSRYSETCFLF